MSVLTKLSDKAYWAMRKAMVNEIYKSENLTMFDVALKHKISPSTLWKWCQADLGPTQIKKLTTKCHAIRGERISARLAKSTSFPRPVTAADILAIDTKVKNKPWDKKKARALLVPSTSPNNPPGTLEVHQPRPDIRSLIQSPTVKPTLPTGRKQGASVVINLDEHGKFIKYEVTGDTSVQVFTRNK